MDLYPLFLDNSRGFRVYLDAKNVDKILKRTRLARCIKHRILPHVRLTDLFLPLYLT